MARDGLGVLCRVLQGGVAMWAAGSLLSKVSKVPRLFITSTLRHMEDRPAKPTAHAPHAALGARSPTSTARRSQSRPRR